ncbi:MAG TPA: PAS domain S-box protein, partial [Burkholderiales bacterium]|nr:PAS domain S-box protein [Burkholderiales bacterium]
AYSEEKPQPRPAPAPGEPWTDLLRHTPSALLIARTDGEVLDVNEAFRRMTGYAKKDLQSLESWLLKGRRVRPDEIHGALEQLRKSFALPEAFPVEQTVWTRTGEPRQWLVHCVALAAESQESVWALFGTDITDRVNAQYVLRTQMENVQQEAAELASLYQAAPAGLAVLDTQLRFLRVNERMAEMDGIPAAEHAGKSLRKLLPHAASVIEPLLNRVIETAKPSSHLAVRVRTPAEPRTERHWMVSCHPLKDEHGRVTRIEWAVEDVTERHAAETSLRENEAALHVIVDNLPAPLCVKDTQGRYLYANRAYERFTQLGSVPVKGKMDHEIFAWEAADRLRENDDEALAGSAPVHSHGNARFKDAVCYYEAAKIALRDREGKAYGVCALYTDLTDRVHAVSDLEASERRYRAIFESSPQPILIDRDNKLVYVNAACVRLLAAQDAQQLLGKSILEFINPAGHKAFQERVQRALRRKDADQALGLKCTRLDGAELDVELEASLYEAGDERAVQILLRDVTLQRRAEDVVRRSEARFRSVAEETPALIRIADAGGACVYWNRQWHRHTGIAADKALGTAWTSSVHAEDRDRVVHALANVRQQREPLHLEYRLRDRENQYRWMLDIAAPRLDDAGAYLGHVACVTDISERKRAEELLRQGAERFKSIAEQAPVLIWLESTRACEYVNDAFRGFLGAHSAGVMGADWFERIHPDDRDRYAQARREAQKRAAPCETEVRVQRADGEYRRMQVLAAPRLSSEGTLEGYVGSLTDITDLRETEQALQEADRRR